MKKKFRELLHDYKVNAFKLTHDHDAIQEVAKETLHYTEETLKNQYHYHFHRLPDANRAEIINMINNYVREAILPPLVESLVRRQIRLEKRFDALQGMTRELLEILSEEPRVEEPLRR